MPCRNEDWVLGLSLRAVLMWADDVIVLDHASTDRTSDIIREVAEEYPGLVVHLTDSNPEWQEMRHRNLLLQAARERGATHVALVDADEVLSGNLIGAIRGHIEAAGSGLVQMPWACLARGIDRYYVEGVWFNNWVTTAFRADPELHWTSATRGGYDFHHRQPMGRNWAHVRPVSQRDGGLMHLQFVSERRLRAKQSLYVLTETLRWPGRETAEQLNAKYGQAVYQSDPRHFRTADVPTEWWEPYSDLLRHLEVDAEPWQEATARRLIAQHGRQAFAGLDLFGI
jgi:hypothetical protein